MTVLLKVFTLLGGLAFFLYGMNVMSGGLGKLAGGSLERSLKTMTKNRFAGMALGAVITIAIQSSSAMTVMLVGLVNSGIMQLGQTIGVIMGSNIGTTLTPWILSLSGVNGTGWIQLLKPENFSPIIAFIGVVLIMMCKKPRKRDIGKIMVGFAVLMYGMTLMGSSVSGLENSKAFTSILTAFENPLLGVLVGAVVTGVIQSSAASVGILQTLAATGQISYGVAIPIIMGQNIGTCVTALISSIGVNKNARKVAVVHITFNLIGTVVCLCLFYGLHAIFHFAFVATPINAVGISAVHTIFNLFTTALLCPFTKQLERFANFVIRPSKKKETYAFLDERLLGTPSIAVGEASDMTVKMATLARTTILSAINICQRYDQKVADEILKHEDELDLYEDKLGTFLVKLSSRSLSIADSRKVSNMLHTIGDFERLGDHAVNLRKTAEEIHDKHIVFSEDAVKELQDLTNALTEILELTIDAFLVKLSSRSLSIADSRKVSNMLHTIGDFERLGDHAVNLRKTAEEIHDKHIVFSEDAVKELQNLTNALTEILELTIDAFSEHNLEMARHVEPLEQVIDCLISAAKSTHVERLQSGKCTIQNGFVLNDLLTNYERVSDHCSNIAVSLIETSAGSFDTHEYLSEVKEGGSKDYTDLYHAYTKKYALQ